MIKQFNKEILRELRPQLTAAIQAVLNGHGVTAQVGSASYGDGIATFKLELALQAENGKTMTKERENWPHICEQFGFEKSDLDREFIFNGSHQRPATIEGIKNTGGKMPVAIRFKGDDRNSFTTVRAVLTGLGREVPAWLPR